MVKLKETFKGRQALPGDLNGGAIAIGPIQLARGFDRLQNGCRVSTQTDRAIEIDPALLRLQRRQNLQKHYGLVNDA
jgi:hypothetical protein